MKLFSVLSLFTVSALALASTQSHAALTAQEKDKLGELYHNGLNIVEQDQKNPTPKFFPFNNTFCQLRSLKTAQVQMIFAIDFRADQNSAFLWAAGRFKKLSFNAKDVPSAKEYVGDYAAFILNTYDNEFLCVESAISLEGVGF